MDWLIYIAYGVFGLFAIIAAALAFELVIKVWHQVILGEVCVDSTEGAVEFCHVANELLDRKRKVEVGTWLKRADYEAVHREVKRRWASGELPLRSA